MTAMGSFMEIDDVAKKAARGRKPTKLYDVSNGNRSNFGGTHNTDNLGFRSFAMRVTVE
jgi:hypothetical protein